MLVKHQRPPDVNARLLKALKQVVAISDRKHDAWDEAKAAIAAAELQDGPFSQLKEIDFVAKRLAPYVNGADWQNGLDLFLARVALRAARDFKIFQSFGFNDHSVKTGN